MYNARSVDENTTEFTDRDWEAIKVYIDIIKQFEVASRLLGGDTYPTGGMVIPMIDQVQHFIDLVCRLINNEFSDPRRVGESADQQYV